ncbi:hypothetical protein ACFPYI_14920 [Halomarina salina]|uniref:Zinc ribbon domain-containing protein n=1 Tax=Halomarina salina TaxID=1872699 RepID=A0ABD5RQI2_9EURY|nr:hypothetical protein [Halomarina salina]
MSELPCVSCGADIPAEASNCPHCGQRQMTRSTAIGYTTVGLPVVLLGIGGTLALGVPSLLDATIGVPGLVVTLVAVYCLAAVGFLHAYAKRRRLLDERPTRSGDETTQ